MCIHYQLFTLNIYKNKITNGDLVIERESFWSEKRFMSDWHISYFIFSALSSGPCFTTFHGSFFLAYSSGVCFRRPFFHLEDDSKCKTSWFLWLSSCNQIEDNLKHVPDKVGRGREVTFLLRTSISCLFFYSILSKWLLLWDCFTMYFR